MKLFYPLFSLFAIIIVVLSCSKDIEIGADLLDNENLSVEFTDTLSLTANTVRGDSVVSFFESLFFDKSTHMIGSVDDQYFGFAEANVYVSASLGFSVANFAENSSLDSMVMVIPFDTLGTYGPENEIFDVEVFQTDQSLSDIVDMQDSLYSNQSFPHSTLLGSAQITPNFTDSITISDPIGDTIRELRIPKNFRIEIDPSFALPLLEDTLLTENDTTLQDYLKGFVIKSFNGNGFIGLNLFPGNGSALELYYTTPDDEKRIFRFELGAIRHNELVHDYFGSRVEQALANPDPDHLLFIQGLAGSNISFDISSVLDIGDKLINKVELEVVLAGVDDIDLNEYPAIPNIITTYRDEDNDLVVTNDIGLLNNLLGRNPTLGELITGFGGDLLEDNNDGLMKYNFNLTNHVLDIRNGDVETTELILQSYLKQQRPNRSVIYGPDHLPYLFS